MASTLPSAIRQSPARAGFAPIRQQATVLTQHTRLRREERCTLPSTVVARADSSVPLHLRTTHSAPKDEVHRTGVHLPPLAKRVVAGLVMGAIGATLVVQGGVLYLCFIEFFVCQAALEYFGFVTAVDVKEGSPASPQWVVNLVTACCMALPLWAFVSGGKIAIPLALCSFVLLSALGAGLRSPRLSTLSTALFGLLYCGYLPTFWLKVRILAAPVVQSQLAPHWPVALGGLAHMTVGMVATFVSISCVVASDVGAFTVGKLMGKTPLCRISPNKTVEGALGGLSFSVLTAAVLSHLFGWPLPLFAAMGLGVAVSFSAVLGDLIESALKRDAGLKDSGEMIPGHGGILDRFDSYIFTGAVVYVYIKCLPLFGI